MPALSITKSQFNIPPAEKLNIVDGEGVPVRFLVRLNELTSREVKSYDDPNKMQTRVVWSFGIHNADGGPVFNSEGDTFTIEEWTGTSTGPKSKARPYVAALSGGQDVDTFKTADDLETAILDKVAWAFLEEREYTSREGSKEKKFGIQRLMAVKDQAKATGAISAAKAPAAAQAPEGLPF